MTCAERLPGPLPAAALALGLLLPFTSLPFFALGYWGKAEPMVIAFHAVSGLAALAAAVELGRRGAAALTRVAHPYVLLPLALGLWTLLAAPAQALPLLSLFGAPQSGFGGLWFLSFAALCAAALLAAEHPAAWRALGRLAIATTLAVAALKAWDWLSLRDGGGHLLIFVAAYYGWLALALPVALASAVPWERRLALVAAAAVAVASGSLTAVGLLALMLGLGWAGERGWLRRLAASRRIAAALVVAAAVLPLALLQWTPWLLEKESLRDRHLVHVMVETAIAADPGRLLLGHGWGRTQDAFQVWLNVSGERLWAPSWTFLTSDYFHSHSWLLETLHAAGLPAVLLALAGFAAIPVWAAAPRRPLALAFALAVTLFHGLWFQLSLSLPLTALALATLAGGGAGGMAPRRGSGAVAVAAALLGTALLGAALVPLSAGLDLTRLRDGLAESPPRVVRPDRDLRGSDLGFAEMARDALPVLARRAQGEPAAPLAAAVQALLAEIDRRAAASPTPLLLTTGLNAMAQLHVSGELGFAASESQLGPWRRWLDRLLTLAPGRSDQAIGYFTALLARNRFAEVAEISDALLARDAGDPVGLYYRGLSLVVEASPEAKARGLTMIRDSILRGMDRFMPIDPQLMALVGLQPLP